MAAKRRRGRSEGIGYGRPPKHTQFRPGVSGNPSGRPKGSKSLRKELQKVLRERITTNGGKTITLRQLIFKQLGHQAGKGNLKGIGMVLKELAHAEDEGVATTEQAPFSREEDELVMQSLLKRVRAIEYLPPEGTEGDTPQQAADASEPKEQLK